MIFVGAASRNRRELEWHDQWLYSPRFFDFPRRVVLSPRSPTAVPMSPLDFGKATESLSFSLLEVMNTPNLGSLVVWFFISKSTPLFFILSLSLFSKNIVVIIIVRNEYIFIWRIFRLLWYLRYLVSSFLDTSCLNSLSLIKRIFVVLLRA